MFVYAISKAPDVGWATTRTILLLVGSVLLIGAFLVIEMRGRAPLVPLGIFRVRTVFGANVAGFLLGGTIFANFFLLTLYVQQVLGYSALKAGVTFVATAGTAVVSAGIAQALSTRIGVKPVMALGLALLAAGMIWYTQIDVHGSFAVDLLPGYIVTGVGIAFAFVPVSIAALAGIGEREAGLASGLINTSQQIGGAIGVAVASTIYATHYRTLLRQGDTLPHALTGGTRWAFWLLAAVAAAGVAATIVFIRREEIPADQALTVPAG
jgi:MFS family permease